MESVNEVSNPENGFEAQQPKSDEINQNTAEASSAGKSFPKKIISVTCLVLVLCIMLAGLLFFVKNETEKNMTGIWITNLNQYHYDFNYVLVLNEDHTFKYYKYYKNYFSEKLEPFDLWEGLSNTNTCSDWETDFSNLILVVTRDETGAPSDKIIFNYNAFSGELYQSNGTLLTKTDIDINELA